MVKKASIEAGLNIFNIALISLFVLAGISAASSGIFNTLGSANSGIFYFVVKYFNVVLLIAITLLAFIGISAFRSGG